MIPKDYVLKVGDKIILNQEGVNAGYGQSYREDCLSGMIIVSINPEGLCLYGRNDGKPNNCSNKDKYWSSRFDEHRREHFDLVIDIHVTEPKSRLMLIND